MRVAAIVCFAALLAVILVPSHAVGEEVVEATLTIDATATREPISPYVYRQFIEHLGRAHAPSCSAQGRSGHARARRAGRCARLPEHRGEGVVPLAPLAEQESKQEILARRGS